MCRETIFITQFQFPNWRGGKKGSFEALWSPCLILEELNQSLHLGGAQPNIIAKNRIQCFGNTTIHFTNCQVTNNPTFPVDALHIVERDKRIWKTILGIQWAVTAVFSNLFWKFFLDFFWTLPPPHLLGFWLMWENYFGRWKNYFGRWKNYFGRWKNYQ